MLNMENLEVIPHCSGTLHIHGFVELMHCHKRDRCIHYKARLISSYINRDDNDYANECISNNYKDFSEN